MPRFMPQPGQRVSPYPPCVDLREIFEAEQYKSSVGRVIDYLSKIYIGYSNGSFDHVSRSGIVTEQFCLYMPTVAAYVAEIELCNAIWSHALGNIDDVNIKVYLQKYLDSHIFVYREERKGWLQEFKTGYSKRTGRDVPLFYVDQAKPGTGHVLNNIQCWFYSKLEARSGNDSRYTVIKL